MNQQYAIYLAEKFLADYRPRVVEKRLAFDAWADRRGVSPDEKRRLWRQIKSISRRSAA